MYPRLIGQCYRPENGALIAKTVKLLERIGGCVPIYELFCNMEDEAAIVAFEGISMAKFENEIQSKGNIVYANVGDSMMPLLRERRDIMVIRKITEPLKKYDAVLFKRPNGAYILHRIVKACGMSRYRIAGDNRWFSEIVPEEWIIGILTEVIKDGKHMSVDSEEYKAYLKKVPWRRFKLKLRYFPQTVMGKIKSVLRRFFK